MFEDFQKRPFVRPLFFWVCGILLYTYFPLRPIFLGVGFFIAVLLIVLLFLFKQSSKHVVYDSRWVWGIFISICFVLLSIEVCQISDRRLDEMASNSSFLEVKASQIQKKLVGRLDQLEVSEEEKSIVATFTLGYRQSMTRETKKRFSLTGVSHVLAVSGFHVAIVCGFLSLLLCFLPERGGKRWLRYGLLIFFVWMYAYVTGLSPSTVRASLMISLFLMGRMLRRTVDSYNTLAAAAFLMLVYDPSYMYDIGFQLSYSAVFSILFFAPRIQARIDVRNPFLLKPWQLLAVTLAAQIGTIPLCLYYFGQVSAVFLLTNLPITCLATLLIPFVFLWLICPIDFCVNHWLKEIVEVLVHAMTKVVEIFAEFPFASVSVKYSMANLLESFAFVLLLMIYIHKREPRILLLAMLALLLLSVQILIDLY